MNAIPNDLRDLLADLVLQSRRADLSKPLKPHVRKHLAERVEQALIDPNFHRLYLNHLFTLLGNTLPAEPSDTEEEEQRQAEEEQQMVNSGLRGIPDERLVRLAIDPVALMCLRAAIFDPEELPDYWWQRAKEFANERRPLKTPAEILEEFGLSHPHPLPGTPLPVLLGDSSSAPLIEQPERWTIDVPLADLQWIEPSAPPTRADPDEQFLRVLLTFWRQETPPRLEVQFGGIASLIGQVSCTARLVLAEAANENRRLTFTGLSESDLSGAILEGEYHKEGGYHFRFRIVLHG